MPSNEHNEASSGLSRRSFLKGVGAGAAGAGLLSGASATGQAETAAGSGFAGPGAIPITLEINGATREFSVEPRVTLLDALRNRLDLTGSKKVCDRGNCGACTVHINGEPAFACSVLAIECEGQSVTTVEGLGSPNNPHPLQTAFVKHDAQQCGFCTPGFVMAAAALIARNPEPSVEDVAKGVGGNVCRCGTYAGMKKAVLEAAGEMKGGA